MKNSLKKILFSVFSFVAMMATSRITWMGFYKSDLTEIKKHIH